MKSSALIRGISWICALLLTFGCISCSPPKDITFDFDESLPAFSDDAPTKTSEEWRSVRGDTLELPDLCTSYTIEVYGEDPRNHPVPGPTPFFRGEIKKIGADYLVVAPIAKEDKEAPSFDYSDELLKYGQCCIVPLWGYEMNEYYSISADDFAVGERVRVRFDDGWVAVNTEYGKIPVLRKVFGIRNLDRAWVPPTT
ncbi:MAG: hypothetical protein IJW40_05780 [Clostridia bacterium]|nr:hypothetical protein [Clostridia bacterium]